MRRIWMLLCLSMKKITLIMVGMPGMLSLLGLACTASAQTATGLGIFEGASDVGAPSHKGSVVYDAVRKEYRLIGGGDNMWAGRDDFFFVWKKVIGDAIITANLKIVNEGAPHRKAGLIIRKDLEPGSVYTDAVVHGSGLTAFQWREKTDEVTRTIHFPVVGPTRLRLERRGNAVTLFAGKDGGTLAEMGSTELAPFSPMYVGLGVCAHDDKAETTALFSDVTVEVLPLPASKKQ
jgi:TolB protein